MSKTKLKEQAMGRKRTWMLLIVSAALVTGCATFATTGHYTVERGETLRGDLVVTSGHVTLEEGSRVTGSVLVTSGHLTLDADAEIDGDVLSTSGDVILGPRAEVGGDIVATSGRVRRAEGSRVGGTVSTGGPAIGRFFFSTLCVLPLVLGGVILYVLVWLLRRARQEPGITGPSSQSVPLVAGAFLVLLGAALFLQNLTDLDLGNWWALFILIPVVGMLADVWGIYRTDGRLGARARGPLVGGLMLLLLTAIFLFSLSWSTLWPLFVIILGAGLVLAR
jgi:hypothetical protein